MLSEKLKLYYFETSKLLEDRFQKAKKGGFVAADGKKYYLADEQKIWKQGVLNSPPFVTKVVAEEIQRVHRLRENLLLAGSPRTLYEAKALIPLLKELYGKNNITIIFLKLQEKETIRRNSQRRICELMRHPILATKETAKLKKCPLDGSKLVRRKGLDDKNVIIIRLKEYMRRTFPMKRYFREQGFRVHAVDGGKSVAEVFASVLKIVKK